MKWTQLIAAFGICLAIESHAATQNLRVGEVYIGQETYNEHLTGNKCYITIRDVQPFPEKGLHCHIVDFQFSSIRPDIPKDFLRVDSRVTNYHRPEFPQLRTCAMNVNGTTSGPEIYAEDTSALYNQIFGGSHTDGGTRYDYFLTLGSVEKIAARARVHVVKAFSEYDVDCVNLERM